MTSWKPSAKVSGGGGRDDFMEAKCEGFQQKGVGGWEVLEGLGSFLALL